MIGVRETRDNNCKLSKSADDWHKYYSTIQGGHSIVLVDNGSFEEAKNADVLVPGKSVVEDHAEGIPRSSNLQTSIYMDLLPQEASCSVI